MLNRGGKQTLILRQIKVFTANISDTSKNRIKIGNDYNHNSQILISSLEEGILVNYNEHSSVRLDTLNPLKDPCTSRSRHSLHMPTTNLVLRTDLFPLLAIFHFYSTSLLKQLVLKPKLSRAAGTFGFPAFFRQHAASWSMESVLVKNKE